KVLTSYRTLSQTSTQFRNDSKMDFHLVGRLMKRTRLSVALFLFLVISISAYAQFSSSVLGSVVDSSGAAVPQAQVNITNLDTGVVSHAASDSEGNFRFNSLAPGHYEVTVSQKDFTAEKLSFTLTTGESRSLPVTLRVGSTQQSVDVTDQ